MIGVQAALRNQISRELNDAVDTRHAFPALLMAMDNFYDTPNMRFQRGADMAGNETQVDFRTGLPTVSGVKAKTGALNVFDVAEAENFKTVAGKMEYSAYQGVETIRKWTINRLVKTPPALVDYVARVSEAMADAIIIQLDADMFPNPSVGGGGTGVAKGLNDEDKIMAVAYPLQDGIGVGFTGGHAGVADGVYEYMGLNLNAAGYTGIKATVKGDVSGANAFGTFTLSNVRRKLLYPLRNNVKANPDCGVVDDDVLDYMVTQAEQKLLIDMADKLDFGGTLVRYAGINWFPHGRLNLLAVKEAELLDSATWRWVSKEMTDNFELLSKPGAPGKKLLQGYFECQLQCTNPRKNGRGVDVRLS